MSFRLVLWDILAWGLVILPFLTGGVWISRPGLFIELSDLGIPVLIVGFLGLFFHKVLKAPLSQTSSVRLAKKLWTLWATSLAQRPRLTLWTAAGAWGLLGALASLRKHWAFQSHSFDLGIFTNTIWNLTHGHGYISSVKGGINLFADHQSPVFWLIAPLFHLIPRAETLLVVQALALAMGGVILFYLARQFAEKGNTQAWIPAAAPWMYWLYLPFRNANAFDFHPEVLMLPLFLAAVTGLQSKRLQGRLWGGLAFLLALGCKESAGPVAAGIGCAWILGAGPKERRAFTRKIGFLAAGLGVLVFVVDTKFVPALFHAQYAYQGTYSQFGEGLLDLLWAPIRKPGLLWSHLTGKERLKFLLWTLGPLGFAPLANPRGLIAALPGYLMLFLSAGLLRVSLGFHYAIEPGVGLFFALPRALFLLQGEAARFRWLRYLPLWILFWALAMSGRSELFRIRKLSPDAHQSWVAAKLLPCIDPDLPLVASDTLVPHLATRHWVQGEDLPLPQAPQVSCWITDRSLSHWPLSSAEEALKRVPSGFSETWKCGTVSVFERPLDPAASRAPCLRCKPECEPGR